MLAESEWTRDDRLRQPVFLGIREDKNAKEVVREQASYVGLAAQKTSSNDLAFCNRAKDV
jgi:ATP-dependent DNA ligase